MDKGALNESFAKTLIDQLIQQGVDYFCCAPGSRSTTLAVAIAGHPKTKRFVHFDERGLCFHALGYAKATKKPAVVLVTSGTAVANLLPAIIEASNERIPLILLTADRPHELRECGANQTCDQVKIFAPFVRWQIDMPCPADDLPAHYLATTISQAVIAATQNNSGPVHINCPVQEPLYAKVPTAIPEMRSCQFASSVLTPTCDILELWAERFSHVAQGVILCGSDDLPYSASIFKLAETLNWPIFADILSPLRTQGSHSHLITHYDPLLKVRPDMRCDAIIQFGNRFVSKVLMQWLEAQTPQFFLHVSDHTMRQDPFHLITHRVHTSPHLFCEGIVEKKKCELPLWSEWNAQCNEELDRFFTAHPAISEPGIFHLLSSLASDDFALFVANSMPIRDANQFFSPHNSCGQLFANRGVSGIDGNIATAVGIAQGTQKPTIAIMGDQTFLHDLNSLAQMTHAPYPVILLVINNSGGGIFSFLPICKRKDAFEEMILSAHDWTFEHAARQFNLSYQHPETASDLKEVLQEKLLQNQSCIIEVTTQIEENVMLHEQIIRLVKTCLSSTPSAEETPLTLH